MNTLRETRIRRKSGFSLAEMTVSVAVFVVLSGFIVHMLVTAKNANTRSYDLYKGMSYAISFVESIKSVKEPKAIESVNFEPGTSVSNKGHEYSLTLQFDRDWTPVVPQRAGSQACYSLEGKVTPVCESVPQGADSIGAKGFQTYNIDIHVTRLLPYPLETKGALEIFRIETTKCYTDFRAQENGT